MAVLIDADRIACRHDITNDPLIGTLVGLTKPDIKAAVDAIDNYLNTNAATINTAIPQPARGAMTAPQKALLLMYVVNKRYVKGA